jgi:hypothetical protein
VAYSNRLADVRVYVSQSLLLGTVLRAAALPSVRLSVVCSEVREPDSSSVVVDELRLSSLRQLREKLPSYIRIDVLPETVAVGNVSANDNQVNQLSGVFSMTVTRVTAGSDSVAIVGASWVNAVTVRCGRRGNSALWWTR